ncbi:MAG TPA: hypothetical protein VGE54_06925 [Brevundimonas sp.]
MPATARDIFSDQFEPIDGDYLYRRRHKDAPVRITRGELDLFMDRFDRAQPILMWGGAIAGAMLIVPAVFALTLLVPENLQDWGLLVICAVFVGLVLLVSNWIWDAPARALKGRPPSGPPYAPSKARRLAYARTSYARMGLGMALCASAPLLIPAVREPAWLTACAGGLVFMLAHLMRKWSAERAPT